MERNSPPIAPNFSPAPISSRQFLFHSIGFNGENETTVQIHITSGKAIQHF
jgi:hypothetical protein